MRITILSIVLAFVTVTSATIQSNSFINYGEVDLKFSNEHVTAVVRSRLHCVALCDQHTSRCMAASWDQGTKTCREFTRTLLPGVTPHLPYTTDKVMFIDQGYTYLAGMIIKFVTTLSSWDLAQAHCVQDGGRLVVLDTLEKYQAIQEVMEKSQQLKEGIWFVGATKKAGTWTLTTGEALNPGINVINDQGSTCLGLYLSLLNDSGCEYHSQFICEK